jgi:hypothetical protein
MKIRNFLLTVILGAGFISTEAQNFKVGEQVVNVGLGLGSNLGGGIPFSVTYEKGFKDGILDKGVLSWGGLLGFATYNDDKWRGYGYNYTYWILGGRVALHYPIVEDRKLDTYAGIMLAYNVVNHTDYGQYNGLNYSPNSNYLQPGFYLGAHYYFTDKISGSAELGYGIAFLTIGVGYKF